MTISECIKRLEAIKEMHGDIQCDSDRRLTIYQQIR